MWSKVLKLLAPNPNLPLGCLIFEGDSPWHHITIRDEGQNRTMYFGPESSEAEASINLNNPTAAVFEYPGFMLAGLTLCPQGRRILMVGLGGGVIPRLFQKFLPQYHLTVVEIDLMVCELAQTFFGFTPGQNVELVVADGRHYLDQLKPESFDQIWLDAFDGDYVPPSLTGQLFLETCQAKLKAGGLLMQNLHQTRQATFQNQLATTRAVFGDLLAFSGHTSGNAVVITQKKGAAPPNWKKSHLNTQAKEIGPVVGPYNLLLELDKIKEFPPNPGATILK